MKQEQASRPAVFLSRDATTGIDSALAGGGSELPRLNWEDALFLDVDGTLLEFAATPGGVVVPKTLISMLDSLEQKLGGALAFISGRPIADLDRLFAPLCLPAAGVHGGEIRMPPASTHQTAAVGDEFPESLLVAIESAIQQLPGIFTEPKRYSVAVHYTKAPHLKDSVRAMVEATLNLHRAVGIEIVEAHHVIEVKMVGFDKGTAISTLMKSRPFRGRVPVFIGDDTTDEDGFAAVQATGGRAYSVATHRARTTFTFADPRSVREWLAGLVAEENAA